MNYLLVNLAVADMIVGMFMTPQFILRHLFTHPDGLAGEVICKFLTEGNLSWTASVVSVISLLAVSVRDTLL
jgi:hypothetical protein